MSDRMLRRRRFYFVLVVTCCALAASAGAEEPGLTLVADVDRAEPISFERDIQPILRKNCLACHNASKAESNLVLETRETIAAGGDSGAAIDLDRPIDSLLIARARGVDSIMPPEDNDVGAKPLASDELGLIRLWIEQGAQSGPRAAPDAAATIAWQPLAQGVHPIYSVAVSSDSQYAACSRANEVFVYHLPTGRAVCRLSDPAIAASGIYGERRVADLDLVQAVAFSSDARLLATGGYGAAKLWERSPARPTTTTTSSSLVEVTALGASRDARWLATGGASGAVQIIDTTGATMGATLGGGARIAGLSFLDAATLVAVAVDGSLTLTSLPGYEQIGSAAGRSNATAMAIVDAGRFVTGHADGAVQVWRAARGGDGRRGAMHIELAHEFVPHKGLLTSIAACAEPPRVAAGYEDGKVRLWDFETPKRLADLEHQSAIAAVAIREDGQRMVSASVDGIAKLWDGDRKSIAVLSGDHRLALAVSAAERQLATANEIQTADAKSLADAEARAATEADAVRSANAALTEAEKRLAEQDAALNKARAESEAAQMALVQSRERGERATRVVQGLDRLISEIKELIQTADAPKSASAAPSPTLAAALAALREALAAAQADAKSASDEASAAEAQIKPKSEALQSAEAARAASAAEFERAKTAVDLAAASAGRAAREVEAAKLALAAGQSRVADLEARLSDARTLAAASVLPISAVAFSDEAALVAVADQDGLVHTYSAETGRACEVYDSQSARAATFVTFLGSESVVTAGGQTLRRWRVFPEWTWLRTIGASGASAIEDRVTAVAFSHDGTLLATGGGAPSRHGELKLWNVEDGSLAREFVDVHSDTVFAVAFSHDGRRLASASADKFLKVFDVADGRLVQTFEGHTHHVLAVAWHPHNRLLATGGADNVVKLWSLGTGEQVRTIEGFTKEVTGVAFLAGAPHLVSSAGDGTTRIHVHTDGRAVRGMSAVKDFSYCVAATLDGRTILSGSQDGVLRLWNAADGKLVASFAPPGE